MPARLQQILLVPFCMLLILAGCGAPAASTQTPSGGTHEVPQALPGAPPAPMATAPALADVPAEAGAPMPGDSSRGAVAPPASNQQQNTPLKAGEVNDNAPADYPSYLTWLASYNPGNVLSADVSERYLITVLNDQQQPVLDAQVRLYYGQELVFEGRTYAGGQTIFQPRALGVSENLQRFRMVVAKGQSRTETTLDRQWPGTALTVTLGDVQGIPQPLHLDVLFLLDATGSMGDEITQIQNTIDTIASRIDSIEPRPMLRFGLVAYRDRGDEYVTRLYSAFTSNVREFRTLLQQVRADGGGDTPEDLQEGLNIALNQMRWSDDAVRLIFLVADAPAHLDYGQEFDYLDATRVAVARGIKIYPIAASNTDDPAEYQFRQLAQQTMATFVFLTYQQGQNAGAPGDTTVRNVDAEQFTVDRLDDLLVQIIQRELATAQGAR